LLPETSPEGAAAEAERIRIHVQDQHFKSLGDGRTITVSIGISSYPHPRIKTHDDLISCADTALYAAKNTGRNRVSFYVR
jgi:diguanylate cyclase (GGDEF)-like protein